MQIDKESERIEFKKSTSELENSMKDISAILNRCGEGTIYFGINDSGEVAGQVVSKNTLNDIAVHIQNQIKPNIRPKITELNIENKTVIKVDFYGNQKPYSAGGKYYIRVLDRSEQLSPDELREIMLNTDSKSIWEKTLTKFTENDVDKNALGNFYQQAVDCKRLVALDNYSDTKLLTSLSLMEDGKLNNAGYFLFSNKAPVSLKLGICSTDECIKFLDVNIISDNIFNLIREAVLFISKNIRWEIRIDGIGPERTEIPEIPSDSIREIVVNAFAHADYNSLTEHEIRITPNQVKIHNPGEFPLGYTPEDFAYNDTVSIPRNKIILRVLYLSKIVETMGSGIKKVFLECSEKNIEFKYETVKHGYNFIFFRKNHENQSTESSKKSNNINKNVIEPFEKIVVRLIKYDPKLKVEELAELTGKNEKTVWRCLTNLREKEIIERIGARKKGAWKILKEIN